MAPPKLWLDLALKKEKKKNNNERQKKERKEIKKKILNVARLVKRSIVVTNRNIINHPYVFITLTLDT